MKKLFGMDQYKTELKLQQNDDIVQYGDEKLKALNGYTMSSLFKYLPDGKLWGRNEILKDEEDKVFQLGWSSIVLAEIQGDKLKIIKALKNTNEEIIFADRAEVSGDDETKVIGILTRAVDTCTFLWLKIDNYIIVAHFNNSKTKEFTGKIYDLIKEKIPCDKKDFSELITEPKVKLFISYCTFDDKNINDFYTNLNSDVNRKIFDRRLEGDCHYSHFEIGLFINSEQKVDMFGDITYLKYDILKKNETPSVCFDCMNKFKSAVLDVTGIKNTWESTQQAYGENEHISDEESGDVDGCCIIL